MAFSNVFYAQQKPIQGKITDVGGDPLPGVSISVKGTTFGTVTDIDGMYYLSVPADAAILIYSYIGMSTQTIDIGSQPTIDVVLEEDLVGLDEAVVVGSLHSLVKPEINRDSIF